MRKWMLSIFTMLLFVAGAFAQNSTTISGTVTDSGSQAWANGSYTFTFVPNPAYPSPGQYTWAGGAFNLTYSGALDGSGHYSQSVPSSLAFTPHPTWKLQVCPNATSVCYNVPSFTISGNTQTLNVTPPAIVIPLTAPQIITKNGQFSAAVFTRAYADSEITPTVIGAYYYNVTAGVQHQCTAVTAGACTSWNAGSGGTGTVTSVGLTLPSWLSVAGSPITGSGTLAVTPTAAQTSHQVIGTCGTATTFAPCALVLGDLPSGLGLTANPLSQFASTTSAQLLGILSNPTGTGLAVFGTSPTLVTPNLGTPSTLVLTNATGLPSAGLASTTGTGAVVLASSPTFTGTAVANNLTVNGTCTGCGTGGSLTVNGSGSATDLANNNPAVPTTNPSGASNVQWQAPSSGHTSGYVIGFQPRPMTSLGAAFRESSNHYICDGNTSTLTGNGEAITQTGGSGQNQASAGFGPSCVLSTSGTIDTLAYYESQKPNHRTGTNVLFYQPLSLSTVSSIRIWMGFTDNFTPATYLITDNNATTNSAWFRYSTSAADTNWQCVTSNGTTQTVTSSGVAANTSAHRFMITANDSIPNFVFYIDGTLVCTVTATLPSANTNMNITTGIENLTAAIESFTSYGFYVEGDH